jgi:hypothetical protein
MRGDRKARAPAKYSANLNGFAARPGFLLQNSTVVLF